MRTKIGTCSFVVLPRETKTTWKAVRPQIGTHSRPMIHMTHMLVTSQGLYNTSVSRAMYGFHSNP